MALPDLIEIVPLPAQPLCAHITVPGSKSITNRALLLAALSDAPVTLHGALWSEDTQVMVTALRALGFAVEVHPDHDEPANRRLCVHGLGGRIPHAGTPEAPLELFVGNAGTAARFLSALVCLGRGVYRLDGTARMRERPQAELFHGLRQLGYRVEAAADRLPALIHGSGPRAAFCNVSVRESSQFASALLLVARRGLWQVSPGIASFDEAPYVRMTQRMVEHFPYSGGAYVVEPDASSGSYFWGINLFQESVEVAHWPMTGMQVDADFPRFLKLPAEVSRLTDLGDSIMTAIALAPLGTHPVRFTHLSRLRVQECDRVRALRTELTKCGALVREEGDTLTVDPSAPLHAADIETYDDHRMAMCFALLGLKVPGLRLRQPACVQKTFPNFFQKLAAPQPGGVGAIIRHGHTRAALLSSELVPASNGA